MGEDSPEVGILEDANLAKRDVSDADEEAPVKLLASTYIPEEHRIRDSAHMPGYRVLTFAQVLKYGQFPPGRYGLPGGARIFDQHASEHE
jgi:hypothetical protein